MTGEALKSIRPYLDAVNVDLKSFRDEYYRRLCRGSLEPVLETIRNIKAAGIWMEITTLIVPGENDSTEELTQIAAFIAAVGKEVPWHVSRFFPSYRFEDRGATPLATIREAERIGREAGLEHIHPGNV
jgi:pyruvate formate lyase activating enzyme